MSAFLKSYFPVSKGVSLAKGLALEIAERASAAAGLGKLWADTFKTNAGIYAAGSSGYTYRGSTNFDVIRTAAGNPFVTMTAADAPAPFVASASTGLGWKAFDGNDATPCDFSATSATISLDCGAGKTAVSYEMLGNGNAAYAPSAWTLYGSNTGAFAGEETTLDTQAGQDTSSKKSYSIAIPASFRYYKFNFPVTNANAKQVFTSMLFEANASASIVSVRALDLAANVTQIMLFADVTLGIGTAAYYVSTDDGGTWTAIVPETLANVPAGKQIRIKVELTGNAELEFWGVAA